MKNAKKRSGFTLLELLIVVVIIGILASFAVPQFNKAMKKARSAEAVQTVGAYLNAEWVYRQENGGGSFTTTNANLLVNEPSTKFTYTITTGNNKATVTAAGNATDTTGITITGTINSTGVKTLTSDLSGA